MSPVSRARSPAHGDMEPQLKQSLRPSSQGSLFRPPAQVLSIPNICLALASVILSIMLVHQYVGYVSVSYCSQSVMCAFVCLSFGSSIRRLLVRLSCVLPFSSPVVCSDSPSLSLTSHELFLCFKRSLSLSLTLSLSLSLSDIDLTHSLCMLCSPQSVTLKSCSKKWTPS